MAQVLKIGPASNLYDLLDTSTDGQVYALGEGRRVAQINEDGTTTMVIRCMAKSTTHGNIVNKEQAIVDHLQNAERYIKSNKEKTPIWIYENANGETAKRALIYSGVLANAPQGVVDELLTFDANYYMLTINRGQWEPLTESTLINATTIGYDDPVVEIDDPLGDVPARLSELLIRGTATNDEDAPLTEVFGGINRKYDPDVATSFNAVWEIEKGTAGTDTALENSADGNTSPDGSTTENCLLCNYVTTVTDATRATVSLDDVEKSANELMTNGGAEDGDLTGWTVDDAGWAASNGADDIHSGSYGFYSSPNFTKEHNMHQDQTVTPGQIVKYLFWSRRRNGDYWTEEEYAHCILTFRDSGGGLISTLGGRAINDSTSLEWVETKGMNEAPANAAYVRVELTSHSGTMGNAGWAIDDIQIYPSYVDWIGDWIVLLRAKVSPVSATSNVYMRYGWGGSSVRGAYPDVVLDNTDWKFTALGMITMPPQKARDTLDDVMQMGALTIDISASRLSGGTLYMDCLMFVPAEHYFNIKNSSVCRSADEFPQGSGNYQYADLVAYTEPSNIITVISESEEFTGPDSNVESNIPMALWNFPVKDSIFVVFVQRETQHNLDDTVVVTLKSYPRYKIRNTD